MNEGLLHSLSLVALDEIEADELLKQLAGTPEEPDFEADDFEFDPSELEDLSSS